MHFPGFQEYEQALLLLEHKRTPFRGEASRLMTNPVLEPGTRFKHDAVGQFAIVYKLRSGGRRWALRCPRAAFPLDVRERCRRIADTMTRSSPRYLLETTFIDQGMSAGGVDVPIMLMEWADGENLRDRVASLCAKGDSSGLRNLAQGFRNLCESMDRDRFAHGDLSHGNVLVRKDGSFVLVDYDTAYREGDPSGRRSIVGTPGYAHPAPSEALMQESMDMDAIPRRVIQIALDVYASNYPLFGRYSSETILFDQDDLEEPSRSARISEIRRAVPSVAGDLDALADLLSSSQGRQPSARSSTLPPFVPSMPPLPPSVAIPYNPGATVGPGTIAGPSAATYHPGSSLGTSSIKGPNSPKYVPGESLKS